MAEQSLQQIVNAAWYAHHGMWVASNLMESIGTDQFTHWCELPGDPK